MSALTFRDVVVERDGRTVLSGIDVSFAAGRLTAVIGPNGAGKSTLLEAAAGLLTPTKGMITLGDAPLATLNRRQLARRRAYLPQRAGAEWPISVERVVALGLTPTLPVFGGLPATLAGAVEAALTECDLLPLRNRAVTSLSGGELARAMLARAIVGGPKLLIVDEPTAGLDPRHAIDAVRRLRVRADRGRTVIMAAHDIELALRLADDVVALRDGAVVWAGAGRESRERAGARRAIRRCGAGHARRRRPHHPFPGRACSAGGMITRTGRLGLGTGLREIGAEQGLQRVAIIGSPPPPSVSASAAGVADIFPRRDQRAANCVDKAHGGSETLSQPPSTFLTNRNPLRAIADAYISCERPTR